MNLTPAVTLLSGRGDPKFWAIVGAGAGVYLFYRGFQLLQRRRLILNIPASKVRSAALGLVEVSGQAIGPYTMPAPITAVPCYYYHTQAWELRQSGKNKQWHKVADESLHVPFYLDDNTGRLLVDPRGAEMDLHCDFHEEYRDSLFSSNLGMPTTVSGFLARHGVSSEHPIKIDEYCIKPKNALFILGTLAENPGSSGGLPPVSGTSGQHTLDIQLPGALSRAAASAMQVLPGVSLASSAAGTDFDSNPLDRPQSAFAAAGQDPVANPAVANPVASQPVANQKIAAAMIKAGVTNPAAWAAVGLTFPGTSAGSVESSADAGDFDLNPKTVVMKGQNNPAFFISWRSQREVAESLGWRSALMIWGGPALALLCLYILAARFGWL